MDDDYLIAKREELRRKVAKADAQWMVKVLEPKHIYWTCLRHTLGNHDTMSVGHCPLCILDKEEGETDASAHT